MPDGTAGGGATQLRLRAPARRATSSDNDQRAIFHSPARHDHRQPAVHPADLRPGQPAADRADPDCGPATTNVTFGDVFEGTHSDPDLDPMAARDIEVWLKDQTGDAGRRPYGRCQQRSSQRRFGRNARPDASRFRCHSRAGSLKLQTDYEWRRADEGRRPVCGDRSRQCRALRITSSAPTVVAITPYGTWSRWTAAKFGGTYTDPENNPLAEFHIQMQPTTGLDMDAASDRTTSWDTGEMAPTAIEVSSKVIARDVRGRAARRRATTPTASGPQDSTGVWSAWAYDDFHADRRLQPSTPATSN